MEREIPDPDSNLVYVAPNGHLVVINGACHSSFPALREWSIKFLEDIDCEYLGEL